MKALGAPQAPQDGSQPRRDLGNQPVPVMSQPMPAYGWSPNNAPAGISEVERSPGMGQMRSRPAPISPQMLPVMSAPRRPPDLTRSKPFSSKSSPSRLVFVFIKANRMATAGVPLWSTTAASNANADPAVNWAEGMAPSAVNDSARATMASVAKWRDDLYGSRRA